MKKQLHPLFKEVDMEECPETLQRVLTMTKECFDVDNQSGQLFCTVYGHNNTACNIDVAALVEEYGSDRGKEALSQQLTMLALNKNITAITFAMPAAQLMFDYSAFDEPPPREEMLKYMKENPDSFEQIECIFAGYETREQIYIAFATIVGRTTEYPEIEPWCIATCESSKLDVGHLAEFHGFFVRAAQYEPILKEEKVKNESEGS